MQRPTKRNAERAIRAFLRGALDTRRLPFFVMTHDGEDAWSFWITDDDTTSYVHSDLRIEWYGTSWTADSAEEES